MRWTVYKPENNPAIINNRNPQAVKMVEIGTMTMTMMKMNLCD